MLVVLTYLVVGVVFYIAFPLNKHCIEAVRFCDIIFQLSTIAGRLNLVMYCRSLSVTS